MPVHEGTLQLYRRNAEAYAGWAKAPSTRLVGFSPCCRQSFAETTPRDSGHDTE